MENSHFTPHEHHEAKNHNEKKNNFQKLKSEIAKFLAGTSLFATLMMAQPASAQSTDKANTLTEQVEKINNEPSLVIQAKKALITYYSEHTDYFHHILTTATNAWTDICADVENIIQSTLEENKDLITSEKDKATVLLMAMELMVPATTFTNDPSIVIIDPEREIDMRKFVANEAVKRITTHFKERKKQADKRYEEATKENERATKENEAMQKRVAEAKANLAKIEARGKEVHKQVNTTIDGIEHYLLEIDITLLPKLPQLQDFIKQYQLLCQEVNRKPNEIWQKFINEYNKIKN